MTELHPGQIITIAGRAYEIGVPAREADAGWPMGVGAATRWRFDRR